METALSLPARNWVGHCGFFAAIQLRKQIEGKWILIVSGLLSIAFGVAIVALPHAGLVSIASVAWCVA